MKDTKDHISFAFLLAVSAAAAPNAAAAAVAPAAELLRPGVLRDFLGPNESIIDSGSGARDDQVLKRRIAQGCWWGQWRRC
jgi:hypothetical protein